MIRKIKTKPEKVFDHLPDNYDWYELYYNGTLYAHIGIDICYDIASFHMNVDVWSHNIKKELVYDWKTLKLICKNRGVNFLVASNSNLEDPTWVKFIKMFGFPEPEYMAISKQEL